MKSKTTNIQFTILNSKNQEVTIKCTNNGNDDYLYRAGTIVKCNCTPPEGTINYFTYKNGRVYCPYCKREAIHVKSDDDLHLVPVGLDHNTMQSLYRLSDTIDYSIWLTVADCFTKLKPDEVDLDYNPSYIGWVTPVPEVVELTLGIREDLQICNRNIPRELEEIKNNSIAEDPALRSIEMADIVDQLHAVFSVVETPYGEFQLYDASPNDDYIVENPLFPLNPRIGNGECWYVKKSVDEIWYIRYNYRDGDDLRMNNVLIDFELKAIGKVIPYDSDVAKLLKRLRLIQCGVTIK